MSLPFLVGGIAIAHEYTFLASKIWMVVWLALFVIMELSNIYLRGLATDQGRNLLDRVHGSFAGSIDSFTQRVRQSASGRLSEDATRHLCTGLLAHIKYYTTCVLQPEADLVLRATLAVPLSTETGHEVRAIRTWCYDEFYSDRRWTSFTLDLAGAPTAFRSGSIQTIDDLRVLDPVQRADGDERSFRSVVSLPVKAGGPNGETLAVVNLDANVPNFFTAQRVEQLLPIVSPAINVIALVLLTRDERARYAFHG